MRVHVPGGGGGCPAGMLLLGAGWHSGGLRVGGGQVFMLEILHNLLGQFCQHSFGQRLFCRLLGLRWERERGLLEESHLGHQAHTAAKGGGPGGQERSITPVPCPNPGLRSHCWQCSFLCEV